MAFMHFWPIFSLVHLHLFSKTLHLLHSFPSYLLLQVSNYHSNSTLFSSFCYKFSQFHFLTSRSPPPPFKHFSASKHVSKQWLPKLQDGGINWPPPESEFSNFINWNMAVLGKFVGPHPPLTLIQALVILNGWNVGPFQFIVHATTLCLHAVNVRR